MYEKGEPPILNKPPVWGQYERRTIPVVVKLFEAGDVSPIGIWSAKALRRMAAQNPRALFFDEEEQALYMHAEVPATIFEEDETR